MKDSKHWGTSRLAMCHWFTVCGMNLLAAVARLWVRPLGSLVFALAMWMLSIYLAVALSDMAPLS